MKIQFPSLTLKDIFTDLNEAFETDFQKNGFEYSLALPQEYGKGKIVGYEFENGFSMFKMNAKIHSLFEFQFIEKKSHTVRYMFVSKGSLVHSLSSGFRYRLSALTSAITAQKQSHFSQDLLFPAQPEIDVIIIQIDTTKFTRNLEQYLASISSELTNFFMNKGTSKYLLYHNRFPLSVSETLIELKRETLEGLVRRFFVESKALELLWMQTEFYKNEQMHGFDKNVLRKADMDIIKKAKNYITSHLHNKITLKNLARAIGTNETKLKQGFKKLYGKTFGEILRNERLTKAKTLLEEGTLSVKEIAMLSGYASGSVFAKRFKEKYGVLPSVYNKR